MKQTKRFVALFLAAMLVLAVSGCGASPKSAYNEQMTNAAPAAPAASSSAATEAAAAADMTGAEEGLVNESNTAVQAADTSRKLIRRVYLSAETKDFDALNGKIIEQIAVLGGYVESSEMNGRGGKGYDYAAAGAPRYARIVVRIPSNKADGFLGMVSEQSNVTSRQESSEDVTLQYVDVESHKKALVIEQERLLALLERAGKLEDIITLEERLSDVRYELQSYESQLRTYDNLVDYTTVTLELYEVERVTPVEEKTVLNRMQNGLSTNLYNIGEGAKSFAVWLVVNLPYLAIWAVIIAVAVLIIRSRLRANSRRDNGEAKASSWLKRKNKKEQANEMKEDKPKE